jgi:hypothetical protein
MTKPTGAVLLALTLTGCAASSAADNGAAAAEQQYRADCATISHEVQMLDNADSDEMSAARQNFIDMAHDFGKRRDLDARLTTALPGMLGEVRMIRGTDPASLAHLADVKYSLIRTCPE